MNKRGRYIGFFAALVTALVGSGLSPAAALVVTPARTEIHLAPSASTTLHLTTTNDDKVEIQVDVSKKDWFVPDANKGMSVTQWLDVHGPSRFYLKPGESRVIELIATCPKDLVGEVVGMTSFLYKTEKTTMVTPMISVSLYLIAAGREKMSGDVKNIILRDHDGQLVMTALVRATGNVHIRPSGTLALAGTDGSTIASMPVVEGTPTYPGAENIYSVEFPKSVTIKPGHYLAKADLSYMNLPLTGSMPFTISDDGKIEMGPMK